MSTYPSFPAPMTNTACVAQWLAPRRDAMVDFTCDLVRLASENPPGGEYYDACVQRIEREARSLALATDRLADGLVLQARYGPSTGATLYLSGHYDVVPAQSAEQFVPAVRDGRVFGRGTSDMKGGLAAMLYAVAAVSATRAELSGEVVIRFVPDEETGGRRGTAALEVAGAIDARAIGMITAEPTGGVIWHASRGAISWRVTATGREAHVGLHYEGISAFDGIMDLVAELRALQAEVMLRRTQFPVRDERARPSILLIGGEIKGGDNFNVVSNRCMITLDRRFNPEESLSDERARLEACVSRARSRGAVLTVNVIQEGEASATSADTALSQALATAVEEVTGKGPMFELCPGLLETRFYAAKGIPAIAYGPGDLGVSHGPGEFIEVARLSDAALIYAQTVLALLT
jgi:succinyl-diaminopimelate desuccinylase